MNSIENIQSDRTIDERAVGSTSEKPDVFEGFGIRVRLKKSDNFLIVIETLTRIGIPSRREENGKKKLSQSCHILHKQGSYAILHFKELYELDGRESTLDSHDLNRRDVIARLLESWGLVELIDEPELPQGKVDLGKHKLRVVRHSEVDDWELKPMYALGSKNRKKLEEIRNDAS